ncbi:ATP-binding protein [Cryocola sp. 340MFSha3.1]|uniref:AAA family ATPase n=1 Tax=Cryocola sp. 340MFSha3.1 TaxID=1169145 RepID=UPI00036E0B64|nr:ATP-binding protein [Cryocola sp. 340MFSha3.1]
MATLFLMVGQPGSGKTTRARELEREHAAIRMSPDEWMKPLFGVSDMDGRRDVLEGRLIWTASQVLRLGNNAILDFGLWGRDERAGLHWLAGSLGATVQTVFVPVDPGTQLEHVQQRFVDDPSGTWEMDAATLDRWRAVFQKPGPEELDGSWRPEPPAGYASWLDWLSDRWSTSLI